MNDSCDVVVIGAGIAGLSCVVWLRKLLPEVDVRWVAKTQEIGGILYHVHNTIKDWVGVDEATGPEMAELLAAWTDERPEALDVQSIRRTDDGWFVDTIAADFVVLATGTEIRIPDTPGLRDGLDEFVFLSTSKHAEQLAGQRVAMIGGGDSAFEGALILADKDATVDIYSRSESIARARFQAGVADSKNVTVMAIPAVVESVSPRGNGCNVASNHGEVEYDAVIVKVGVKPVYPDFDDMPDTDAHGYVIVDAQQRTDLRRLYAVGDVTNIMPQSVATSSGAGIRAAYSIFNELSGLESSD